MNKGQEQFLSFILERVQDGKQDEAKVLLAESFAKQAEGTFNSAYMSNFIPKIIAILKPECIEEVKTIMTQFGSGQHQ